MGDSYENHCYYVSYCFDSVFSHLDPIGTGGTQILTVACVTYTAALLQCTCHITGIPTYPSFLVEYREQTGG